MTLLVFVVPPNVTDSIMQEKTKVVHIVMRWLMVLYLYYDYFLYFC